MYSKLFLFDFNIFLELRIRWPVCIFIKFPGQHLAGQDEVCVLALAVAGEDQELIVASFLGHLLNLVDVKHVRLTGLPDREDLPDDPLLKGFSGRFKGFDH